MSASDASEMHGSIVPSFGPTTNVHKPSYSSRASEVEHSGLWSVPLRNLEREWTPTWYFAITSTAGRFSPGPASSLRFTVDTDLRFCCFPYHQSETYKLVAEPNNPNVYTRDLGSGRREVLTFLQKNAALLERWAPDGRRELTQTWHRLD